MTLLWPSTAWGASVVAYVCVSYLLVHDTCTTSKLDMPANRHDATVFASCPLAPAAQTTCWCPGCRRCRAVKTIFIGWCSRRRPKKRPAPQHIRYRYMKYTFFITCSFILAESRSATNTGSGFTTLVQWVSARERERENPFNRRNLQVTEPEHYHSMVKMHLSFLLDLHTDECDCSFLYEKQVGGCTYLADERGGPGGDILSQS